MTETKERQEIRNKFRDTDLELVQRAVETKTEIILHPRRSHTIKGVPVEFDYQTLRVFIDTGKNVESVLLSEIGHFIFPKELWNLKLNSESKQKTESATDYMKRKNAEK